jgi:hypothetical protein
MATKYKVIKEHSDEGRQGSVKTTITYYVVEIIEGRERDCEVYTIEDKTMPDDVWEVKMIGAGWFSIPIENVEEIKMSNNQKWMWVVGLTLAAWGIFYWSQKEK